MKNNYYHYDEKTLSYREATPIDSCADCNKKRRIQRCFFISAYVVAILCSIYSPHEPKRTETRYEKVVQYKEREQFSAPRLVKEIKECNFRFPHIVMAQAIVESSDATGKRWNSRLFLESKNLFGMTEAGSRPTTALGTDGAGAYYKNWKKSVLDRLLFECVSMIRIYEEENYYQYLDSHYAQKGGRSYSNNLKLIIRKEKLKQLFE